MFSGEGEDISRFLLKNCLDEAIYNGGYLWVLLKVRGVFRPDVFLFDKNVVTTTITSGNGNQAAVLSASRTRGTDLLLTLDRQHHLCVA